MTSEIISVTSVRLRPMDLSPRASFSMAELLLLLAMTGVFGLTVSIGDGGSAIEFDLVDGMSTLLKDTPESAFLGCFEKAGCGSLFFCGVSCCMSVISVHSLMMLLASWRY